MNFAYTTTRKSLGSMLPALPWALLPVLMAIYLMLFLNQALWEFWRTISGAPHAAQFQSVALFAAIGSIITAFLVTVAHPRIVKFVLSFVVFIAAANAYFANNFGTIVDVSMIRNIMETDLREMFELLTFPLAIHLLIYAGIPILCMVLVRIRPVGFGKWLAQMLLYLFAAMAFAVFSLGIQYKYFQLIFREHRELRLYINPTYPLYSLCKYFAADGADHEQAALQSIALDARPSHKKRRKRPLLTVLVVGETARADHFSLNGYSRITNPALMKENVLSFGNAWSCGTSTAESVPCMFSDLGRKDCSPEKASQRQNLLDVLQRIDVDVLWIDNNSGSKGVAARVPQIGYREFTDGEIKTHCGADECFDSVLVDVLKRSLKNTTSDTFIVLHQLGEHGPSYFKRHPPQFLQFTPECQQNDSFNCDTEALINAYDNALLYTDHILSLVIQALKEQDSHDVAVLYMSDHGESLGENGVFLHGHPWLIAPDAQKHVPMILWVPEAAQKDLGIDVACLRENLQKHYGHDNLFHTFLGLYTDRKSESYDKSLDIFQGCRN